MPSSDIFPPSSVRGMNDILPAAMPVWQFVEQTAARVFAQYAYQRLSTPIVEHSDLFVRGIGQATDIVEKEMYVFTDALNGERLALRPENTASVVRASLQHHLLYDGPKRFWYFGPMFRHERPQRGRYRQFHQIGAEALGFADATIDAEVIVLVGHLLRSLGLSRIRLEINSLGDSADRLAYRSALQSHLRQHLERLDDDARRRIDSNPLRVLDSKHEGTRQVIQSAPSLADFLSDESRSHFSAVLGYLDACGISYQINPRLVRGLDYYNRTVFEWITDDLGAQGTVAGGGRYDSLVQQIGGEKTPSCPAFGFALGVERVVELLLDAGCQGVVQHPQIYLVYTANQSLAAFCLAQQLRQKAYQVQMHGAPASFKAQFKKADASCAALALVLGDDEMERQIVGIKPLRGQNGAAEGPEGRATQTEVKRAELETWLEHFFAE